MLIVFLRAIILFTVLLFTMRLMGKRQIGEIAFGAVATYNTNFAKFQLHYLHYDLNPYLAKGSQPYQQYNDTYQNRDRKSVV